MVKKLSKKSKFYINVKIVQNCKTIVKNGQHFSIFSKKIIFLKKLSKLYKNVAKKCQKLSNIFKKCQKLSKVAKIVKNRKKLFPIKVIFFIHFYSLPLSFSSTKIVKQNCQTVKKTKFSKKIHIFKNFPFF